MVAADSFIIKGNPFLHDFRGRFPQRIGIFPIPFLERALCIVLNPAAAACCFVHLDVQRLAQCLMLRLERERKTQVCIPAYETRHYHPVSTHIIVCSGAERS